jgi:hypothetical protein
MKNYGLQTLITDTFPVSIPIEVIAQTAQQLLDSYKSVAIAKEEEITRRTQIREQSRVMIAAYEADTKKFMLALEQSHLVRMEMIESLSCMIRDRDIDEGALKMANMILNYLASTDPVHQCNYIGQKP